MKLILKLVLALLLVIPLSLSQESDDYDDSVGQSPVNSNYNSTDDVFDDEMDDESCSAEAIIEQMTEIFTPEDYEEGKQNIKTRFETFNETLIAINRLQQYSRNVSEKMSEFNKRINNRLSELLMTIDLPPDCMSSLVRIVTSARNGDLWALKFFDAQPSMSMSLVELSGPPYGNFDQCLSIESPEEEGKPKIMGKYCSGDMSWISNIKKEEVNADVINKLRDNGFDSMPINGKNFFNQLMGSYAPVLLKRNKTEDLHYTMEYMEYMIPRDIQMGGGYCLPTTCTNEDLSRALNQLMYPITRMPFKLHPECEYRDKPIVLNRYQWLAVVVFSVLISLVMLCSVIDSFPLTSKIIEFLNNTSLMFYIQCFSMKRNLKSIFDTKQYEKFKAMDGMRAFLSLWVVLVHTYESGFMVTHVRNYYLSAVYKMSKDYRNLFIPNPMLMDNFMFISAILLCNTIMSKLEQSKGQFNYFHFIAFRYLRMLPILVCGILISYLLPLIGDGPFWSNFQFFITEPCYDKWWKPLLMLTNRMDYKSSNSSMMSPLQCLTISWYASADFQLYALSPIAFLVLYKMPKIGIIWNFLLLLVGMSVIPITRYVFGVTHVFGAFLDDNVVNTQLAWQRHYWAFQPYIQTYIVGILVAYAIRHKPNAYLGGRIGELCLWIITCGMSFGMLWWQKNFADFSYKYDGVWGYEKPLYLVFHKVIYLTGFSWLIYACATSRAGIINTVMGWKGFKVIDNLLIEIYILHIFVIIYRIGTLREQVTYNDYYILTCTVFDFIATYILSVLVALIFTKPFGNMTMSLLRKPIRPEPKHVMSEPNDMKIDILNDKKFDSNNNQMNGTDGINGYTNPVIKEILDLTELNNISNKESHKL